MNDDPHIRVELLSNPLYLSGARELIASVAHRLGFGPEPCGQIALAVDEALCNVIRHGYQRAADKPIWISIRPHWDNGAAMCHNVACDGPPADAIEIVIEDEAPHINLEHIKSRSLDDVRPGGLGVHIIRTVMDEVKYEHRQPQGMRLTLTKYRTAHAADPLDARAAASDQEDHDG